VPIRASVPPCECSDCGDIDDWNVVKNVANPNGSKSSGSGELTMAVGVLEKEDR
jgi:hypothetical protein